MSGLLTLNISTGRTLVAAEILEKMSEQLYSHRVVRSRCDYGFVVISSS